jgi:predicted DNA-binding transcriptional regulator AlpA
MNENIKVTRATIYLWTRRGQFPLPRHVGGRMFWVASEIDDWERMMPTRVFRKQPGATEIRRARR